MKKITAIKHSNGKGIWVLTHAWNSNAFYAYYLDQKGLLIGSNNPVISYTGSIHQGVIFLTSGYMKASPDGSKIALATKDFLGFSEIALFNNATGIVDNPIRIKYNHSDIIGYGIEFSPNGNKLYITQCFLGNHSLLFQFDVSKYDSNSIDNSGQIIYDSIGHRIWALQVALNKKIYVSTSLGTEIGVINFPDKTGSSCNFIWNGLTVGCLGCPNRPEKGLPTFMQSYFFIPDFKAEPLCFGDSTKFSISNLNGLDSVKWDFGNSNSLFNNFSSSFNPIHKFTDTGNYHVILYTFHQGKADTSFRDLKVGFKPVAAFTVYDTSQCLNENEFLFTNHSTITFGSMSAEWDFGDTTTAFDSNTVSHHYGWNSTFKVKLTALSDYGCADTFSRTVVVRPSPNSSFTANDTSQCLKANKLIFTNTSNIYKNTPLSYKWYFGSGDSSILKNPVYSYKTANSFNIKLITTSNLGCKDTFSRTAIIYPQANPGFSINDSVQCLKGNSFSFADQTASFPTINNRLWKFGDGKTDTSLSALHQYLASGTFQVSLITNTTDGCKDTAKKNVFVNPAPDTAISVNAIVQCLKGNNFSFVAKKGSTVYGWDFGDGKIRYRKINQS